MSQTLTFPAPPRILAGAAVCGPREGQGPLHEDFDYIFDKQRWSNLSFEQCEQQMQEKAARLALAKAGLEAGQADLLCGGDLINQITPSGYTARQLGLAYWGLFSACATLGQALSVAALAVHGGAARYALALSGSHTCTAERQFRYPNEYGAQKPPYAQHTVTACGAALLAPAQEKPRPSPGSSQPYAATLAAYTVGRVCDERLTDPFQVGAAMAPAFADTVATHLRERQLTPDYYDLILSGDLGRDGLAIGLELLRLAGVEVESTVFGDCGLLLLGQLPAPMAGGSGCGCAAGAFCGHLLKRLQSGELKRILLCPTGALFSPVANQQKESIPAICHAVAIETTPLC